MSKLVRLIIRHYGVVFVGTIIGFGVALSLLLTAASAGTRPLFCVLVPHFKDEYWLSVSFGLEQEAARQSVELLFFEAGGYSARVTQIDQINTCVERGADAILIGAVTSDHPSLLAAIAQVEQTVPVFGLVNELHAPTLSGRIGVSWRGMGYLLGQHLSLLHPAETPPKTVVFLTGPAEAGWTGPLETGLRDGLRASSVKILEVFRADTGLRAQLDLVEMALARHPNVDYLIGDAPAIEAAFGLFNTQTYLTQPLLLSTYVNHSVLRGLQNGQVVAASFDDPVQQGVLAIQQAVSVNPSIFEGRIFGPDIALLTHTDKSFDHIRISPADYFPAIQ